MLTTLIQQQLGNLLVLSPEVYWQVWDRSPSWSEKAFYADGASAARASEAELCEESCKAAGASSPFKVLHTPLDTGVLAYLRSQRVLVTHEPSKSTIVKQQAQLPSEVP
jgi:hypothetical protein